MIKLAIFGFLAVLTLPLQAQEDGAGQRFLSGIKSTSPKTVVAVFDISNSMSYQFPGRPAPVLNVARPFAQDLVNTALRKGDRFVLISFDKAPHKVFDTTINGNLPEALAAIPKITTLSKNEGTDIRWAHYEGLKVLESEMRSQRPAYLILLTDGFHDSPTVGDRDFADFYVPGRLDRLPDTSRARDYARLARQFKAQNCGVGVQIADNGMVVEKVPDAPTAAAASTAAPAPAPETSSTSPWAALATGATALAALAGTALWGLLFKPIRVGLGQPNDARKNKIFSMKHGSRITLGGVGAATIPVAFDVPQTKAAVGHIVRSGQNFWFQPAANQPDGAQVMLNGQPLNSRQRLSFGDQIRVKLAGGQQDHLFTWNEASAFRTLLNR